MMFSLEEVVSMSSASRTEIVWNTNFKNHMNERTIIHKVLCSVYDVFFKVSYEKVSLILLHEELQNLICINV